MRRALGLGVVLLLVGGGAYLALRWLGLVSGGGWSSATVPVDASLLRPDDAAVGLAACDDYVARTCGCPTDVEGIAGSGRARCETARLWASGWREARSRGTAAAEIEARCRELLDALPRTEPACRQGGPDASSEKR
jgi:hypothetical protein